MRYCSTARCQTAQDLLLVSTSQNLESGTVCVPFIVSLSMATSLYGKPTSSDTFHYTCRDQTHDKN